MEKTQRPNPQTENGFIRIATQTYEALVQIRIAGEPRQCLDFIIRKTYGWQKKEDHISLSQFVLATGLSKVAVSKSLKKLQSMNLIVITKKGKGNSNLYRFNKLFGEWKPLPKKVMLPKKVKGVTKKGKELLPKMGHTKDTYTKDTITKEREKPHKRRYGEFKKTLLTDNELIKLKERLGEQTTADYIQRLDDYIGTRKDKYSSHYRVILKWFRDDGKKKQKTGGIDQW